MLWDDRVLESSVRMFLVHDPRLRLTHCDQHICCIEAWQDDMSPPNQCDGVHGKHINKVEQRGKVAPHITTMKAHL